MEPLDTKIARRLVVAELISRAGPVIEPDPNHVDLIADLIRQRDDLDKRIDVERQRQEEEELKRRLAPVNPRPCRPA